MCRNHSHAAIVAAEGVSAGDVRFFVVEMAQDLTLEVLGGVKTTLPRGRFIYFLPLEGSGGHLSPDLLRSVGTALGEFFTEQTNEQDVEARDNVTWLGGA